MTPLLVVAVLSLAACGSGERAPGLVDTPGGSGTDASVRPGTDPAPCEQEGATKACGRVERMNGNYVTCSVGHAVCKGGKWGDCIGDHLVTQSFPHQRLTTSGLRVLAISSLPCTNVCDPYCFSSAPDPGEVDAGGIQPLEGGGVTLVESPPTATPDGGPCRGLQCQVATCPGGGATTLSGTVYDPAGLNPLYNAFVYIPASEDAPLPAFGTGASCDTCGGTGSFSALQAVQTDASGNFTLSNVPSGKNIPVIVQMGKWRREILLSSVLDCTTNTVKNNCTTKNPADCVFRLPRHQADGYDPATKTYTKGDIPQIAIVSGNADPFDCLLLKAGIDPIEFGDNTSSKRIHYYQSDTNPGNSLNSAYGTRVNGSKLWNNLNGTAPSMMSYDVILLPCEGAAVDKQSGGNTPYQNLINYANAGGRSFITHFGYVWIQYPGGKSYVAAPDNWAQVANWAPTGSKMTSSITTQDPMTGTVNTSFPKGGVFSTWLANAGATTSPPRVTIHQGRQDLTTIGASTQPWMSAYDSVYGPSPNYTPLFTFNAPYAAPAANQCGRVVFSDFHVSANALVGSKQCLSDLDCGYSTTCSGEKTGAIGQCSEPCRSVADCPNGTFACAGSTTGTCSQTACATNGACGTGRTCRSGTCTCGNDSDCNGAACTGKTCLPISCSSSAQCGNGTCGNGICNSVTCHSNGDCGLGTCGGGAKNGSCAAGAICHRDTDCGPSGTCGSGTSSTAGACSTNAQTCHRSTDCDSNSCGTGTGSTAGTCAKGNTTACHAKTDCDSNSCGTGTGATAGTCSTGGTICHVNTNCDSNSCGAGAGSATGTCANGNATVCHRGTDCDSNSCGTGTGAVAGTCSTGGQTCHANANCDSNSCGAGAGSVKGICTAGACTTNAQCGTSGTCVLGRCLTGSCSVDTNCGTSGGVCTGATCGSKSCAGDAACTVGNLCNNAKCSTPAACTGDASCPSSGLCTGAKCSTKSCAGDAACTVGNLCNNAKCSTPAACAGDASCPSSGLCTGAKCSTPATCAGDAACPSSGVCTGAKCSTRSCAGDAACTVSNLCNNAKCSTSTCSGDSQCPLGVCSGAKCTPPASCGASAECGKGATCTGAKCAASACNGDTDCGSGSSCGGSCQPFVCTQDSECASGICNSGTCACTASEQCGGSQSCVGASQGLCQRSCTRDAECAPDRCINGQCGGCASSSDCHDNAFAATCSGIPAGNYGTCTPYVSGDFPLACRQGVLSPQEKALEFMFFDLTACVSPDNLPPPPPPVAITTYGAATFTEDFTASCPVQTAPVWREFDWQAQIPNGANIVVAAQSGDDAAHLAPAVPLNLATATANTDTGPSGQNYDIAYIDTGVNGSGAFNTANPPVGSRNLLRVTLTLNPTPDQLAAPTLLHWKVQYDCAPAQ